MATTLQAVYKFLAVRKHWTRRSWARDAQGREVDIESRRACRFCLQAAILKFHEFNGQKAKRDLNKIKTVLRKRNKIPDIMVFNDISTHAEVLEVLSEAMKGTKSAHRVVHNSNH